MWNVCCLLHLSLSTPPPILCSQHALDLQLAVANLLQLLVHSERNQQVLCEAGLHSRLLQRCSCALADEDHPLHPPLQRMFERLASQALQPMVLRYARQSPPTHTWTCRA